jgi:hypothetical protein
MASVWRADVLARSSRAIGVACAASGEVDLRWARAESQEATLCAAVFEDLVAELGIKTAQRRWWGFVADGSDLRLVASVWRGERPVDGRDARKGTSLDTRDGHANACLLR